MGLFSKDAVSITLKTHTCYPEIMVEPDGSWEAKLLSGTGEVCKRFTGRVPCGGLSTIEIRKAASKQAVAAMSKVAKDYLI